jgi:hypothetical protein
MMLVSMVGHAIFQTAERNGPSTIERSYRRVAGAGATAGADGISISAGAVTSVKTAGLVSRRG